MKVVIIRDDGKSLFAGKVEELTEIDYVKAKRESAKNRRLAKEELEIQIERLKLELAELKREIKVLKGEE